MDIGMLWFDDTKGATLPGKIALAAKYYAEKYGQVPDMAYVNPQELPEGVTRVGPITVKPLRSIMPKHLWIGNEAQHG